LELSPTPDEIETHPVACCAHCSHPLSGEDKFEYQARQVIDLRKLWIRTREHRAMRGRCPRCNRVTEASFPADVKHSVQHGAGVKTLSICLKNYQVLQKISGTFRTLQGAQAFCRTRGHISMLKKHKQNVFSAIRSAIEHLFPRWRTE
jgi:hypothetical protein